MPDLLAALADAYRAEPMLGLWAAYPYVSEAEDESTDHFACWHASVSALPILREHGFEAVLIYAHDADIAEVSAHYWIRVRRAWVDGGDVDVDLTARQLHNLEHPQHYSHAEIPAPLLWASASGVHPIAGGFYDIVELGADEEGEEAALQRTRLVQTVREAGRNAG
jgi:hypothetical protein